MWIRRVGAVVVVAVALTACGAPVAETSPSATETAVAGPTVTPTPTPEPPPGPEAYADVEELRLAYIEATGEPCPPLSQYYTDANGVICTQDGWQLFWKSSLDERNHVLQLNADSLEPSPFVVGPNWLINGPAELADYEAVAAAMNATVWTHDLPIPSE